MSNIIRSGNDVQFERVSFQTLESIKEGKNAFFVPRLPVSPQKVPKDPDSAKKPDQKTGENSPGFKKADLEAAREEAFTKGKVEGRREAEKKFHSAVQALGNALEQVSALKRSMLEKSREDMVRLIMTVARKVIRTEVEDKKEIIVRTVNAALQNAIQADEYYIKVNPDDLDVVAQNEPLFLAGMKGLQNIHFIPDQNVSKGGCIAEARAGDVDATIESQLDEIYQHLRTMVVDQTGDDR